MDFFMSYYEGQELFMAASRGKAEEVQRLLRTGVSVDAQYSPAYGAGTALFMACENRHLYVALLLLVAGADPKIPGLKGYTPLHFCAAKANRKPPHDTRENAELAHALVRAGADPDATTTTGFKASLTPRLREGAPLFCEAVTRALKEREVDRLPRLATPPHTPAERARWSAARLDWFSVVARAGQWAGHPRIVAAKVAAPGKEEGRCIIS